MVYNADTTLRSEHKNMPLEDALGLVDRDFERYTQGVREGRILPRRPTPHKSEVSSLLTQAASGEHLSPNQLQQVIDALEKQKQHRNGRNGKKNFIKGKFFLKSSRHTLNFKELIVENSMELLNFFLRKRESLFRKKISIISMQACMLWCSH